MSKGYVDYKATFEIITTKTEIEIIEMLIRMGYINNEIILDYEDDDYNYFDVTIEDTCEYESGESDLYEPAYYDANTPTKYDFSELGTIVGFECELN